MRPFFSSSVQKYDLLLQPQFLCMSCKCSFIDTINVFYDVVNGEHMSRHFLRTNPEKWTIVEIVKYLNLTERKKKNVKLDGPMSNLSNYANFHPLIDKITY